MYDYSLTHVLTAIVVIPLVGYLGYAFYQAKVNGRDQFPFKAKDLSL
jgi:hypothetical protein